MGRGVWTAARPCLTIGKAQGHAPWDVSEPFLMGVGGASLSCSSLRWPWALKGVAPHTRQDSDKPPAALLLLTAGIAILWWAMA